MAFDPKDEPGEHYIRLVQVILGLVLMNAFFPCVAWPWRLPDEVIRSTGLPGPFVKLLFLIVPGLLVLLASVLGLVLARSVPSRLLFAATALLGIALPLLWSLLIRL
jgi:hypothetical protein